MKKEKAPRGVMDYIPSPLTITAFVLYLTLIYTFYFLLSQKTGAPFDLNRVLFSVALAFTLTLFLLWIRSVIIKNPYLGLVLGVGTLVALLYALFLPYQGPYTTTFAIIGSALAIAYFMYVFFMYRDARS